MNQPYIYSTLKGSFTVRLSLSHFLYLFVFLLSHTHTYTLSLSLYKPEIMDQYNNPIVYQLSIQL